MVNSNIEERKKILIELEKEIQHPAFEIILSEKVEIPADEIQKIETKTTEISQLKRKKRKEDANEQESKLQEIKNEIYQKYFASRILDRYERSKFLNNEGLIIKSKYFYTKQILG